MRITLSSYFASLNVVISILAVYSIRRRPSVRYLHFGNRLRSPRHEAAPLYDRAERHIQCLEGVLLLRCYKTRLTGAFLFVG